MVVGCLVLLSLLEYWSYVYSLPVSLALFVVFWRHCRGRSPLWPGRQQDFQEPVAVVCQGQQICLGLSQRVFSDAFFRYLEGVHLGTLGEASFMACLLSCSRDSREGSEKTDLNWWLSLCCHFPDSHYFLVVQPLVCLAFCVLSSFGDIILFIYDQYA